MITRSVMDKKDKVLEIVSSQTIDLSQSMKIVTPTIYATLFNENAKAHNYVLDDEVKVSKELMEEECSHIMKMRETNHNNASKLSQTTSKAITAIQEKDEHSLNEVLQETEKLRKEIEALKETVYKDELTNIFNRKWLKDHYIKNECETFSSSGTLAIIDLNFFKQINDTYGHTIGDKVLIFIANNLKKTKSHVVRYGGDEFLVIFENESVLSHVLNKINTIRKDITSKKLKAKQSEFKVSFSIGLAGFEVGDNFSSVVEIADKNMYKDKEAIKKTITGIH